MGRLRTLDPSRTCTYAANNGNQFEGINSVIPVRGINYLAVTDIDKYHRDHPLQPLLGSEEASTLCTRGIYANDTIRGYVSDDDVNAPRWGATAERWWRYYADRPWLAGAFVWTGFDYRGEPTPYAWPCINSHFGVMDVCGFPKNNFYYYRSWWTDNDVLHLAPHWNWAGREGQMIDVWCQSNCDSVELSLNGAGLGTRIMPRNSHLEWNVRYAPGRLEARGWKAGRELRETVETTGEIAALRLSPDRPAIRADGEDVCVVNVTGEDDHGREVPVAGAAVHFTLTGPGRILGVGNGDPSSHEPDKCAPGEWERRLFNGKCQIILQAGRQPGMLVLRASAGGGMSAEASIRMNAARIRPYIE
jgi:beta-galactosidase